MTPSLVDTSRAELADKARTFHLASRLLPAAVRDDAAVVYAFCRLVDDTVDEARDLAAAGCALDVLEWEVRGLRPARPLVAALRETAVRRGMPLEPALELIAGVRGDLGPVRVADDEELLRYCYRVAGTVGLMMCGVLGVRSPRALPHAVDLGIAMQLTNIARDVAEDAMNGRVYLPLDRLAGAGVAAEELLAGRADAARVARVVGTVLEMAERYYVSGDAGMRDIPWRCRAAILVAARVYRAIGLRLRRRGCDALAGRQVVPWTGKAAWGLRAVVESVRPAHLGLTPRPGHDRGLH
ncbi:MAG TPA: phytoene/squalene synthase family protein, partial [Longimicrobiaceae bacterium]|nr:phytoene/squalene synthase family protein [Longimicrobiaceae bacterium]